MAVHTCPRCELRFELQAELEDHLVRDHRFDPDKLRPHPVPAPRPGARLVVVVGNHTLLSDRLREAVQAAITGVDADVHVVVPVHHDDDLDVAFWRGRVLAERVVGPHAKATVDAGVGDPVALVERSLHGAHADRIILSTFPPGLSRWLEADVADRLRKALGLPVQTIVAEG